MSTLPDLLKEIDSLREQLEKLKPIKAADEERLWKKFRLEWNYNSNHIEGNTLTYGQTELLLMFDKTTGDHEMREYEEMKAHDAVIHLVREFAKDRTRELSESDIRQWNKTILVRPFWSDAQTASGKPTRKLITPGEYKKDPNSVRLQNGELFHYASPEETPFMMNDLVNWYRDEVKKGEMHPVELAALLHYKFVRIHPFDDSNGRTSRLLINYELLRNNLPPVIIKSADKKGYLFALNKADVGDWDAFVEYIGEQLKWSLELNIKAANGESIEEDDDIDKEIAILTKEHGSKLKGVITKSDLILSAFFQHSFSYLLPALVEKHQKLDLFFVSNQYLVFVENRSGISYTDSFDIAISFNQILEDYETLYKQNISNFSISHHEWSIQIHHSVRRTDGENLSYNETIRIKFGPIKYEVTVGQKQFFLHTYSHQLTKEEINFIVNETSRDAMKLIK